MTMALPRSSPVVGSRPAYLDGLYRDTHNTSSPSTSTSTSTSSYRDAHYPLHSHSSSFSTISTASSYSLRSPPSEKCNSDTLSIRSKKSLSFLSSPKKRFGYILQRHHRHTFPQTSDELQRSASVSSIYSQPPSSSSPSTPILEEKEDEEKKAEVVEEETSVAPPTTTRPPRPTLPKLQTTFAPPNFGPPAHVLAYERKALPAIPRTQKAGAPVRHERLRQASRSQPPPATRRYAPAYEGNHHVPVATDLGCLKCYYFVARNCNGYVLGGNSGDACDTCLVRYSSFSFFYLFFSFSFDKLNPLPRSTC